MKVENFQLNSPNDEPIFEVDDADYLTAYRAHQTKHFYDSKMLQRKFESDWYRALKNGSIFSSIPPQPLNYYSYRKKEE